MEHRTFTDTTTLEELQSFADLLTCPDYTYSEILKLHAYYVSKREIPLEKAPHFLSDDEQEERDKEFIESYGYKKS